MKNLLVATNNPGKLHEFAELLFELNVTLRTPAELGLVQDVVETGQTYADNARLKAAALARASGLIALGDDSGLEVDALSGAPGLYSARYAGSGASDAGRRAKLMHALRHAPEPRRARFRCALAVAEPEKGEKIFDGVCEGQIILEERGTNGFGYDPIFYLPDYGRTLAELPSEIKNQVSHRARAVQAALPYLKALLAGQKNSG